MRLTRTKRHALFAAAGLVIASAGLAIGLGPAAAAPSDGCTTIASGDLKDSFGNTLVLGYDQFGYNYQANMFNGTYDSVDRKLDGKYWGSTGDIVDDRLIMKWSSDWLSNKDCNGDGKLDRGTNGTTSQGWLTNESEGDFVDGSGTQHYTEFVKIVWVGPGGDLWGQYTVVLRNYNDTAGGSSHVTEGVPGFGLNDGWTELG